MEWFFGKFISPVSLVFPKFISLRPIIDGISRFQKIIPNYLKELSKIFFLECDDRSKDNDMGKDF